MLISRRRPFPWASPGRQLRWARDSCPAPGTSLGRFGHLGRLALFLLRQQRLEVELAEQRAAAACLSQLGAVVVADPDDRLGDVADRLPGLGGAVGIGESL